MSSKTKTTAKKDKAMPALVPKLRFPEFRDLQNWSETNVGRISDTVTAGGTPSTSEKRFWGGDIRWMNSGELNDKKVSEVQGRITREGLSNSSTKVIPPRCVLIGLAGQGKTRGTVAMNLVELCINQSIAAIYPNNSAFNSDFLYHDLDKRYDELRRLSAGGEGRGGLNLQIIKSLKVALPSLPEQQKIAECLSSVDELLAAQARKLDALKTHKKGLMQQLIPREGETQPRLRFPEFQNAGEWHQKSLGGLCRIRTGKKDANEGAADGTYPFFTCAEKHIYSHSYSFDAEAILIAGNANVGQTNYYNGKFEAYQRTYVLTDFGDIFVPYLYSVLSANLRPDLLAQVQTSAMSYIRLPMLEEYQINAPTSQAEQQRIAACLTSLDDLIAAQTQKLEALKTHKKGLMQQLFPSREEVES